MIRSELCKIADINPATFNSHRRNGDLPFDITFYEAEDGKGRTWARFDFYAATLLLAAKALGEAGVTWGEAARLLRERRATTRSLCNYYDFPGIHAAMAIFAIEHEAGSPVEVERAYYQGPIGEIVAAVERQAEASTRVQRRHWRLSSLVSVDLSAMWQLARRRAQEAGFEIDEGRPEQPE